MIQDLMLPVTGTAGDDNAITVAVALAANYGAHVSVVQPIILPLPIPGPWGITPDLMLSVMYAELRAEAATQAIRLRNRLGTTRELLQAIHLPILFSH